MFVKVKFGYIQGGSDLRRQKIHPKLVFRHFSYSFVCIFSRPTPLFLTKAMIDECLEKESYAQRCLSASTSLILYHTIPVWTLRTLSLDHTCPGQNKVSATFAQHFEKYFDHAHKCLAFGSLKLHNHLLQPNLYVQRFSISQTVTYI